MLVSCCRRVLAVMTSILWILQNSTTSLHSNWENMQALSLTFHTMTFVKSEKKVEKKQARETLPLFLPQSQQSVSGNSKTLSCRGYSGPVPSARSGGDTADATCPWSVRGKKSELSVLMGASQHHFPIINFHLEGQRHRSCDLTRIGSTSTPRPSKFFLTVVTSSLAK